MFALNLEETEKINNELSSVKVDLVEKNYYDKQDNLTDTLNKYCFKCSNACANYAKEK